MEYRHIIGNLFDVRVADLRFGTKNKIFTSF